MADAEAKPIGIGEAFAIVGQRVDVDALRERLQARGAKFIGIDGPGGSGKSTLARILAGAWPGAAVVEMDDFYRPTTERPALSPHGAGCDGYDRERVIAEVLGPLRAGTNASYQRLDWGADRLVQGSVITNGSVVILEGVYSTSRPLWHHLDYAIWVTCPYDLRLKRGIERDGEHIRGRWVDEWMPAEERYLRDEQPDQRADLQLDGGSIDGADTTFQALACRG